MRKHVDTLTIEQSIRARFYYLVSVWPALLAITVPKIAVAGLIIRIFTPDIWTKTIMSVVVCIGVVNYIVISALSTFQCRPVQASWDPRVEGAVFVSAKVYLDLCYFTSCESQLLVIDRFIGYRRLILYHSILRLCRLLSGSLPSHGIPQDEVQYHQEDRPEPCPRPWYWRDRSRLPQNLLSRRSGFRQANPQEPSSVAISDLDTVTVVQSGGEARGGQERPGNVTVNVDRVSEHPAIEQGREVPGADGPGHNNDGHTTVVGQK